MAEHNQVRTLQVEAGKAPVINHLNLRRCLHDNPMTVGLVEYDEHRGEVVLARPIVRPGLGVGNTFQRHPFNDSDATALAEHFNDCGFRRVSLRMVWEVIALEAQSSQYHPVRDYLTALEWDGISRLSSLLIDHCGTSIEGESEEERKPSRIYIEEVTRKFFIAAVARVFEPGCKVDTMIVLEGPQGALKSQFLRALAVRDDWFSDSLPHNLESKDARLHLRGVWIVELSEIAQFRGASIETLKAFLSCQIDKYRPPYGHSDIAAGRQCVFAGTTNVGVYLRDKTGNRRFWPAKVGTINLPAIRSVVDQLWAEAVVAYRSGERWWLDAAIERIAAVEQEGRQEQDVWLDRIEDYVASYLHPEKGITTDEILAFLDVDVARRGRSEEMRVGTILQELGFQRKRRRDGEKLRWRYYPRRGVNS